MLVGYMLRSIFHWSRCSLVSDVHLLANVQYSFSTLIPHLFRRKFTVVGSVLFASTERKRYCRGLNTDWAWLPVDSLVFSTHGSVLAAHASIAVRIAPYSNSRVGLWPTFSQIVLRVKIVLSFSRISLTREKPESIQSRKKIVSAFCTRCLNYSTNIVSLMLF